MARDGVAAALIGAAAAGPIMRMTAPGLSAEGANLAASLARPLFLIVPLGAAAEVLRALLYARRASVVPAALSIATSGTAAILVVAFADGRIDRVAQAYVVGATAQLLFILFLAHRHGFRYPPPVAIRCRRGPRGRPALRPPARLVRHPTRHPTRRTAPRLLPARLVRSRSSTTATG